MPIRLVQTLTPADERMVREAIEGFVPEEVFDAHGHLFHSRHFAEGRRPVFLEPDTGYGLAEFRAALGRWLPGRKVEGLFFGYPHAGNNRVGENAWVAGQLATLPTDAVSRGLALVAPEDGEEPTRQLMRRHGFIGIKCYRVYAPIADTMQARIEDFAPAWMWRLCHEIDGVLMLHIMRSEGIADADNLEAIRRLCGEFPRCQLVLAHIARSFNYRNALEGLAEIADLDNVVVDTSAVTETEAMRCALDVLGPRRVLFGADYMVSEMRGKCFTMGDGFSWIYADDLPAAAVTQFENFALVGVESVRCLREACENLGLNAADARDIFRNNGLRLIAPHLPAEAVPAPMRGPELWKNAREKISCGTGLMAKRAESFDPVSWPSYFSRCSGAHVWDLEGRRFVDFAGGVGAILLGYGDREVSAAVHRRVTLGNYCTLASPDEVALAELLLELHPWAQRVRYARGGGEALSLAVRVARAATGRSGVAFCGYHGWSDWYLAANLGGTSALEGHLLPGLAPLGVPRELAGTAVPFKYNDLAAFEAALAQLEGRLAAVVLEPMRSEEPRDGFLEKVAARCRAAGAVLVIDEVTSGWRFGFPGACTRLGLAPDIAVYAKAMSNGHPCGAIIGRAEIMDAAKASFISSSYWTDGVGAAAALACIGKMRRVDAQPRVWGLGERIQNGLRKLAAEQPTLRVKIGGQPAAPSLAFDLGEDAPAARALMIRRMLSRGHLFSTQLYAMLAHDEAMIDRALAQLAEVLGELAAFHAAGRLRDEAGGLAAPTAFSRLA